LPLIWVDIPESNICVSRNMPEKERLLLKQALVELDDRTILQSIEPRYTGFTSARHEDYNEIRIAMQRLGLL